MAASPARWNHRAAFKEGESRHEEAYQQSRPHPSVLEELRQPLAELMRSTLRDTVITAGTLEAVRMLDQQREALCGPRYKQIEERRAHRHGWCEGSLVMGGRRVTVKRPRVRSVGGRELELPLWSQWSQETPLTERALAQMVLGVSTRGYASSLEKLPMPVKERGESRSAVSHRFACKGRSAAWPT